MVPYFNENEQDIVKIKKTDARVATVAMLCGSTELKIVKIKKKKKKIKQTNKNGLEMWWAGIVFP